MFCVLYSVFGTLNIQHSSKECLKNGNLKAKQKVWLWASEQSYFPVPIVLKITKSKTFKTLKMDYKVPFCLRVSVSIYVSVIYYYYWAYSALFLVSHIMRFSTWNSSDCPPFKYKTCRSRNTIRAKFNFCLFPYTRFFSCSFFMVSLPAETGLYDDARIRWQNVSWNLPLLYWISNKLIAFISNSN